MKSLVGALYWWWGRGLRRPCFCQSSTPAILTASCTDIHSRDEALSFAAAICSHNDASPRDLPVHFKLLQFALATTVDMTLPPEFQKSYHERFRYPESLVPSNTAIYSSKLKSYRQRLDDNESQLCLIDGKDEVANIFEVPIIDLDTHDGKGQLIRCDNSVCWLTSHSSAEAKHSLCGEAYQMVGCRVCRRATQPRFHTDHCNEERPKMSLHVRV